SNLPVKVTLTESGASSATATVNSTLTVVESDSLSPIAISPLVETEGTIFSGIFAEFSDSSNLGQVATDFTATIDWADGSTTAGTVEGSPPPGSFDVSGSHAYADEGAFKITTTLTDDAPGTATATTSTTFTIQEGDSLSPTGSSGFESIEGQP